MRDWLFPVLAGVVRAEHGLEIVSPTYDLLTPAERVAHALRHPRSFLNGTPSEEDDVDRDYQRRRAQATTYIERELEQGTWNFRPPALYILEIQSGPHIQVGVVGDVPSDRFPDAIRPHEATRPDRVENLADYLDTVGYGSSPVGLAYRRHQGVDAAVKRITTRRPLVEITLEDGDRHRVWLADNDPELTEALADVPHAYIIDGHHRVAATLRRERDPQTPGGRFLAVAFPADALVVYPYHRWVEAPIDEIGAQPGPLSPLSGQAVAVTRAGESLIELRPRPGETDVAALARGMLADLGVEDERTDPRLRFVPGYPDAEAVRAKVAASGGVGFVLAPCPLDSVLDISDRGEFMPPKATFFSPKPRSGVFLVRR